MKKKKKKKGKESKTLMKKADYVAQKVQVCNRQKQHTQE